MKFSRSGSCEDCPYFSRGDSENPDYCDADGSEFVDPWIECVPDWCPLEDAPDDFVTHNPENVSHKEG